MAESTLKMAYRTLPVATEPNTFCLVRIVGNDLPPRHRKGQARENLQFILENEPALERCERRWVVNRIVDQKEEQGIVDLLESYGQAYVRVPFRWEEYARQPWDLAGLPWPGISYSAVLAHAPPAMQGRQRMRLYRHKNNYVMHNNGARNIALREGSRRAKWALPWDGNCFITVDAWQELLEQVDATPWYPYFIVPMARMVDNGDLLNAGFRPKAAEEPQIVFRRDAFEAFDEAHPYGRRPKVELLWRLGVRGPWDAWHLEPWDLKASDFAPEAGRYRWVSWVARLYSGNAELESGYDRGRVDRGVARVDAVTQLLDGLDERVARQRFDARQLQSYPEPLLDEWAQTPADDPVRRQLRQAAEAAMTRGPYSVVDKTTLPPSGDPRDYWHPAPYYWPAPVLPSLMPYRRKDGQRIPGTHLYEPASEQFDRTRLQRLFDDTTVLALAWRMDGDRRFAEHAARLVRRWFLDPRTRMNPHLRYAQVRCGRDGNRGSNYGVIEMKDLYFFLDGIRLLVRSGALTTSDETGFRRWLEDYLQWITTSDQGRTEWRQPNNHGTYYDLQVAAIAAYLDDTRLLLDTLRICQERLLQQFAPDGSQPEELKRPTTAHYCCFNLQGWVHLAQLAENAGSGLWRMEGPDGRGLRRALEWLLAHMVAPWPYQQIDPFDEERFLPLRYAALAHYGAGFPMVDNTGRTRSMAEIKPLFFPHDGIKPFWMLSLSRRLEHPEHRQSRQRLQAS